LVKKIWEWKIKVKGSLYYYMVASKDVKNDYEHVIYITNYFVAKDIRIFECNLHLIWATIVFTFFITSPNVPNLGYCSIYYKYLTIDGHAMSNQSQSFLVIVKCSCICFQTFTLCIFQWNLKWQKSKLWINLHFKWLWIKVARIKIRDELTID